MPRSLLVIILSMFIANIVSAQILTVDRPSIIADSSEYFLGSITRGSLLKQVIKVVQQTDNQYLIVITTKQ